ncbi:Myosin-Binding Protein H-Like [Manis pentadactyla]|nr:Myosin-Binding Protein H-Like [Manis pentadactyla]
MPPVTRLLLKQKSLGESTDLQLKEFAAASQVTTGPWGGSDPATAGRASRSHGAAHSLIPISQGKPRPPASWTCDGCTLDASK